MRFVSLNNDNVKEVPPLLSNHVLHAFITENKYRKKKHNYITNCEKKIYL